MKLRAIFASISVAALTFGVNPERPARFGPPAANAATSLVCSSVGWRYSYCQIDTRRGVRLVQQLSNAACIQGRTWGTDPRGIWVDRGCSAQFSVATGSNGAGTAVGAAIIGGIVGAMLSSGSHDHYSYTTTTTTNNYRRPRYNDAVPPAYDRYGEPNYDRRGRYQGCHGLGCTVDRPEEEPDHSQDIDTRPQFDKEGNPNFDTHGNYIGCHGMGCQVDSPDAASDSSSSSSDDSSSADSSGGSSSDDSGGDSN